MTTMSDQEFARTEALLRQRLAQLAGHAPTAVHLPDEVPVVATNRATGRGRRAGVIAAVTALIGAGGFTTYSFLGASNDGGAATPEEAVTTFVSALESEDVLGMIDVTLPEEVGALRAALDSATADAWRVGLLSEELDLTGLQGIDISIDDVVLDTNFFEDGLAVVTATSGTVSASFDPSTFPLGDSVRALLGEGASAATSVATGEAGPGTVLMTVERGGRWYVSVEYTVAEYIRQAAGWEMPGPLTRTPVGFDSPEAAVTGFYERLATLDLGSALDTFAPGEDAMAWLAQSWLADTETLVERSRAEGWSVQVSGLSYETFGQGDRLTLRPLTFTVAGTTPPGFDQGFSDSANPTGDPQPFTFQRADGCTTVTGSFAQSLFGPDPLSPVTVVDGGYQVCDAPGMLGGVFLLGMGSGLELPAVSVVQSSGKWYVSPLGTALSSATIPLHDIDDGASLFDSAFAPLFYGGLGRTSLELIVTGQAVDTIDAACLPALTVEDGIVTGVVANPPPDAIRVCTETASFGGSSATGSGPLPVVTEAPAMPAPTPETLVPVATSP